MKPFLSSGALVLALCTQAAFAETITLRFGDNASDYARDGVCDDPRFFGQGVSVDLDDEDAGHDAADCRHLYQLGSIKLWIESQARAATKCSAIKFGNDTSEWAKDGECDDPRFKGPGVDSIVVSDDLGRDATDCRKACNIGALLRAY
ncbi:MAG: hypothetical protein ACRBCL_10720 [Maritimibacter sp.]